MKPLYGALFAGAGFGCGVVAGLVLAVSEARRAGCPAAQMPDPIGEPPEGMDARVIHGFEKLRQRRAEPEDGEGTVSG